MNKSFIITKEERNRILNLHEESTKNQYLILSEKKIEAKENPPVTTTNTTQDPNNPTNQANTSQQNTGQNPTQQNTGTSQPLTGNNTEDETPQEIINQGIKALGNPSIE